MVPRVQEHDFRVIKVYFAFNIRVLTCTPSYIYAGQSLISVPSKGFEPNVQQRFDRIEAVWNQARLGIRDGAASQQEDDFEVITEPSRPLRTPPTPEEVDAIRTAKASGESDLIIAECFNNHRSTVWRYTKNIR